jgi:hypothetical protein
MGVIQKIVGHSRAGHLAGLQSDAALTISFHPPPERWDETHPLAPVPNAVTAAWKHFGHTRVDLRLRCATHLRAASATKMPALKPTPRHCGVHCVADPFHRPGDHRPHGVLHRDSCRLCVE